MKIDCATCHSSNNPDGPGLARRKCWTFGGPLECWEVHQCGEREECDGTEPCPDCAGTGSIDLDAELAEARRYLCAVPTEHQSKR